MSISIWDYEKPLDAMMLKHDHIEALVMRHEKVIQELKQSLTTDFKQPTKICGPNLEETLNAAGFYRKKEWIGLTREELAEIFANCDLDERGAVAHMVEVKLRNKNT